MPFDCFDCKGHFDGDPWWYAPLGGQWRDVDGILQLGAPPPIQGAAPLQGLEARSIPLCRECLDEYQNEAE
jgi:hypothetical protein